jgi:two-component system cell cycle response regulator
VVLAETAKILLENAREVDMIGRYGGEEFIAILPGADEEDAALFAERVRSAVEQYVFRDEGKEIHMTVSAGVASGNGASGQPDELIKQADRALYVAKESGRNRIVRATEVDPEG